MINEQQFELIDDVPVFMQNNVGDVDFDLDKLTRMVAVNNARIAIEEPPTIVVGHDDPQESETKKPVVGFIREFKLGLRNGINTVFAKLAVYKNELLTLNRYPRRSIEIGRDSLLVPRISLLGGSEPALDLGLLVYQKDTSQVHTEQVLKYSKDNLTVEHIDNFNKEEKIMVPEDFKQQVLEVLGETDIFAFVKELMTTHEKEAVAEEKTEMSEEGQAEDHKDGTEHEPEVEAGEKDVEKAEDKEVEDEEDSDKVQSEDDVEKEKDDEDKDNYKKQLAELTLKFQKSEREKSLIRLATEGFDFDIDVELEDCIDMTEAQFAKHVERIKRFSKMAPVNLRKFSVKTVDMGGISSESPAAEAQKIKDYALANNMKYRDAEKILKKK